MISFLWIPLGYAFGLMMILTMLAGCGVCDGSQYQMPNGVWCGYMAEYAHGNVKAHGCSDGKEYLNPSSWTRGKAPACR